MVFFLIKTGGQKGINFPINKVLGTALFFTGGQTGQQ